MEDTGRLESRVVRARYRSLADLRGGVGPGGVRALAVYTFPLVRVGGQAQPLRVLTRDSRVAALSREANPRALNADKGRMVPLREPVPQYARRKIVKLTISVNN